MAKECGDIKYIKCSKCKSKYINDDEHINQDFGFNRLNKIYKTCVKCRNKNKINKTNDDKTNRNQPVSFVDYYVKLPIINMEAKQDKNMRIDNIVVINHTIKFDDFGLFYRKDNESFTYKEFTKLDSINYYEGKDPNTDYMPNEYVAPVLMIINGVTHRTSCSPWFPLADCSDAIKLKQLELKQEVYPIYVKKCKCPMVTIMNHIGLNYIERLPENIGVISYPVDEEILSSAVENQKNINYELNTLFLESFK
jgi:hypothetical protein